MNLNQTLQEKYPHLEISVLKLSEAQKDNESKRIDSEYFKREYLENIEALSVNSVKLETLMVSGYYGVLPKSDDYLENGLGLIRGKDIRNSSLEEANLVKVPHDYFQERYCIHKNDILFLVKGATIGYSDGVLLILEEPEEKMIFNGSVFKLQVKDINPAFLYIFMTTEYFTFQKLREVANNGIEYNSLSTIKNFLIPIFPMPFQLEIEKMVKDSHKALEESKELYKKAEEMLYLELGLNPKNPLQSLLSSVNHLQGLTKESALNISIRTLKESFLKTGRLDSEYYQSKYENIEAIIHKFSTIKLKDLVDYPISSGATPKAGGADYTDSESGIPFLRAVDLKNALVETQNLNYIKQEIHIGMLKRTKLQCGDVLFSIAGVIGRCAVFNYDFEANINQALSVLRFSEAKGIRKLYLTTFFNSQFGQIYLEKYSRQGLQTNLNLEEVGNLEIPKIDSKTQEKIANHIQESFKLRAEAKALLEEAKAKIESTIAYGGGGLIILQIKNKLKEARKEYRLAQWELISSLFNFKDVTSKNLNISIRSFKDSFKTTGRLDSEYYQKKYEINNKMIMNKEYNTLDNLVQIAKSVEPGSDLYKSEGIPFIRVANLTQYGLSEGDVFLDEKDFLPQDLQALYPKKDTILFSKDGSVGIAYCIKENQEIVTSSAILHLHIKNKEKILPEYLTLFLNSIFTKLQAQRDCGGSIISHWRIEDIKNVLVAVLDIKIQEKIAKYMQESFNLRKKSKQLLDNAKNKVEEQIQGKI